METAKEKGNDTVNPQLIYDFDGQGNIYHFTEGGLTKREYFAGLFMNAIVSRTSANMDVCARDAVRYADALLKSYQNKSGRVKVVGGNVTTCGDWIIILSNALGYSAIYTTILNLST
ncbi:MAG: hypothetical protein LBH60_00465 [Prevotellaceae bacterium]|jgi:hypothetical protein|nr:hypothetical protein [Prevotellaceae bacterium]